MIPVAQPYIGEKEIDYTRQAVESGWISSHGEFINRFENGLRTYLNDDKITSLSNGTVALHLALVALGIGAGDEVIIPASSFIATLNAVLYTGATPVFIDIEEQTWGLDPSLLESMITYKTKAVIAVHLYGVPCQIDKIKTITDQYNIFLIEDNAEAFGGSVNGKMLGTIGDVGTFSFFGNKVITTGEGGAIFAKDRSVFDKIIEYKNHGMSAERKYYHQNVGYNYRMTNLQAAVGLAQIEKIDEILMKREKIKEIYDRYLSDYVTLQHCQSENISVNWMYTCLIKNENIQLDELSDKLKARGIDNRRVFMSMNKMPYIHKNIQSINFKVANLIHDRGISLPTFCELQENQLISIAEELIKHIQ